MRKIFAILSLIILLIFNDTFLTTEAEAKAIAPNYSSTTKVTCDIIYNYKNFTNEERCRLNIYNPPFTGIILF
jgi:hypothetical protein